MKFYLVYKNHGLYDPILDDSEDIYAPTGPDDLDQGTNVQELRQVQIETKEPQDDKKTESDYSFLETSTPYSPSSVSFEKPIILNLNYKDVFPELSLDELPSQIKYKLPVSEQYDPEGKRVKEKAVYDKNIIADFEQIKKLAEQQHIKQTKDVSFKKEVCDTSLFEKTEKVEVSKQETKHFNILEESELHKIKQTAKQVIEDSLSKAVSMANQLNNKSNYKFSESLYEENKISSQTHKLSKETPQRSNVEKQKLTKKVSFEDDYNKEHKEKISSVEATKREVRVADEVKKFETFDIQMDSKLNVEERKLLTQRDIEEAIEAGTVRQRTGMFKTGTDKTMTRKYDQKICEIVKSDVKSNLELAKQRVYNIGLQIIPRIRTTVQFSRQSTILLKRFLLQMTKVMITLHRFIPIEKRYNFTKSKRKYEEKKENHEYIHKIDSGDEAFRRGTMDRVEEIKKPKLSGAKIAQIEGLKPAELTDRMNIVISEFLRKSGKEEQFDVQESHLSHTSTSKSESETQDEFLNDTSFSEWTFDKSHTGDEFTYGSSFEAKTFDKSKKGSEFSDRNEKLFEEIYETKTQSYEMREMKEEKRYSESKTSKYDSKLHETETHKTQSATRADVSVPITYIAIVEAHVYTNKNAIFEEQMRRMSESMKQTDLTESDIIYYRCEVSVFYRQFREPTLPPTVVIESIEEIPSEQVFEKERQDLLQTCETGYEDTAKKLAVQKISEVIEPLLKIKEVKSVNIKQAYPAIETPLKLISEQTTVTMEKEENILQKSKLIETSLISIEKPVKSVVETSEIKDEERSGFVESQEVEERKPQPILEPSQAIAETSEIFIEEEAVGMLDIAQPIVQLPQPVKIERAIKSVAETSEVIVDEANIDILEVSKALSKKANVDINAKVVAEITEVSFNEKEQDTFDLVKITAKEPGALKEESVLSVGETHTILPFEPPAEIFDSKKVIKQQGFITIEESKATETTFIQVEEPKVVFEINEHLKQQAHVEVEESKAITTSLVHLEEPKEEKFDLIQLLEKQSQALLHDYLLPVATTLEVLPEGPKDDDLITPKPVPEKASIDIEEFKTASVTYVSVEEPKDESLETFSYKEKESDSLLEKPVFNVAEKFDIVPEGPLYDKLETPEIPHGKANIIVEEIRPLTISIITPNEPHEKSADVSQVKDIKPQFIIEDRFLPVVEATSVVPDEPKDSFAVVSVKSEQADIKINKLKGTSITVVYSEEPKEEDIKLPMIEVKQQQPTLETVHLTAAETSLILSEESKITFDVAKTTNQQAHIEVIAQKAAEASLVFPLDSRDKDLVIEEIIEKKPKTLVERPVFTAAENSIIMSEEKVEEIPKCTKPTGQKATVYLEGLKVPNTIILVSEEPSLVITEVEKLATKEPHFTVEQTIKTVAVINVVETIEVETEFTVFSKSMSKEGRLTYEAYTPVFHTTIIVYEDAANYISEMSKLVNQAKVIIVETTATAIAKSTFINCTIEKEEIVDVSKYTVELAEDHVEKEAARKVKKEITVDVKDIDWSSASSTISSAPSSPFIQEYVFGIATGHEYRVQSPQETELHIVQPAKDLYGVDSANTSYTLTFEAAYEEEEEILQMEEFGDVAKKNQFWISDVKTMETIESSDARIHLVDVTMGVEAHKASQKYVSIQDSTIGVKSRSQSFDTSADFELSLQSLAQSEARETQISDVEAVATIDLKSERSFKTVEDVESQAKVNIKSKSAKALAYSEQSVDVSYGLTLENEIVVDGQSMKLDAQTSLDSKTASAKSTKRTVKKGAKKALKTSETDIEASYDYQAGESTNISKENYTTMEGSIESRRAAKISYAAMEGSVESRSIAEASCATANLKSCSVSEARYSAMEEKLESSSVSKGSYAEDASLVSLQSRSISLGSYAAAEANLETSATSEARYSSKQASHESKTSKSMEMDARQKMPSETSQDRQKLSLETDLKETKAANGVKSPSPEDIPSTPLRDVYIFRLRTPAPEETTFIPRDCSFTPESVHEDDLIIVNGMVPHIDTKIVRVLYSPPLETTPSSPVRKAEPVFTKPGLRGGSETPEFLKPGLKSGSRTPEFTKEEILEIGRKSALLASEIDKTIRSIEEYKESVGIAAKIDKTETKGEERLNENEKTFNDVKEEKEEKTRKSTENKVKSSDTKKTKEKYVEQITESKKLTELDDRKEENIKSCKSMLSRFSQI